jgi:hypothetical protein
MQLIALLSIPYAGVGQCPEKVQVEEKKVGCCKKKTFHYHHSYCTMVGYIPSMYL